MITSLMLGLILSSGQDSALFHNTFDRGVEGWSAMQINGAGAKLTATYDAAHLKNGPGSLDYSYKVASGEMSLAAVQVTPGKLAKMGSLHMWLNCDHATSIVVSLSEHNGGRYSAICHVPKNEWQEINLSTSDFLLATEADAPKDPDGKLDVDQIESIALIDIEGFLSQNSMLTEIVGISTGSRHLYVSDIQALEATVDAQASNGDAGYQVDNLNRPQMSWLGVGVDGMSVSKDTPFKGTWLKLDYHVGAGHVNGVVKSVHPEWMAGKKRLVFNAGANKGTQLFVQIEQTDGAKFRSTADVPGQAHYNQFDLAFSEFVVSEDSPVKDAKLDISKVKQITFMDISGMTGSGDGDNTLYISPLTVK